MTKRAALLALADRCEAAPPEHRRELLGEAFWLAFPVDVEMVMRGPFRSMLGCGGFESAALTLVPEGWDLVQVTYSKGRTFVTVGASRRPVFAEGEASTRALAIAAAALRALAEEIE